jgi:hypothetical protein
MISIFNGRERTLGGCTTEIYAQVSVEFRQYLHYLKGPKLSVFLAISLHADARGWAFPSRDLLARETGYNIHTISTALTELCKLTINGQRLLLRHQKSQYDGTFGSNHYLIFPSPQECAQYESDQLSLPCVGKPHTVKPHTVGPHTVNLHTKNNHTKGDTSPKNIQGDEEDPVVICPIHKVPMHLCKAQDGTQDTWYAHKFRDGTWCKPSLPQEQATYTPEYCEKWGILH